MSDLYDPLWTAARPYMWARKNNVHIPIVFLFAEQLVERHPEADPDIVLPAALLHDVGWAAVDQEAIYREGFGPNMYESAVRIAHEREGARLARELLPPLGYAPGAVDEIATIIAGHDSRLEALSLNDQLVKDADKLWRCCVTGASTVCDWMSITPGQYYERVRRRIDGLLFTEVAREMARAELARTRRILRLHVLEPGPDLMHHEHEDEL